MKKLLYSAIIGSLLVATACKPEKTQDESTKNESASVSAANSATEASQAEERVYNVKVQTLVTDTLQKTLDYTSTLIAFEEVYFASAAPGRIEKIHVEVGDRVKKGQVLVDLDKTQLVQAKIQLENARVSLQRIESLLKTNSISEQQYDQVKTQFDLAESNVRFLEENTRLLSPLNGVITGKYFEDGEMFSAAPNTQAGKAAIVTLMQINPLKAQVNVSETFFPDIYTGMKAEVKSDVYKNRTFYGDVYRVFPTIDPMTRTFRVEVELKNDDELLRPGMFTRVNLYLGSYVAIVVPSISVIQQEGTNDKFVFINDKGIARKMKVSTGKRFDDKIEILANGIQPGQKLIVAGQGNLMDGFKVKTVN